MIQVAGFERTTMCTAVDCVSYLINWPVTIGVENGDRYTRERFLNNKKSLDKSHANGIFSSQLKWFKFELRIIL